jgi:hypothetical protein
MRQIVDNGFQPFFRLGISWPLNRDGTPDENTPTAPPLDPDGVNFTKFAELCRRTVMHYTQGWDSGFYYTIPRWEVWNEPDGIFWSGTQAQFYRMYQAVAAAIKADFPALKVGAPAALAGSIISRKPAYIGDFMAYCAARSVPLDFYAWHLYGQENPYSVREHGEYVRQQLDAHGFTAAESYLDEINLHGGQDTSGAPLDSAKNAAYLASVCMTVQESPIDRIFWYRGNAFMNLLHDDTAGGAAGYTWPGYAFKIMNLLSTDTPVWIEALGSEVFEGKEETVNFMTIAGKSGDGKALYVAISNYSSSADAAVITLTNLPWKAGDSVTVKKNIVREPAERFTETAETLPAGSSMSLYVSGIPSPSVCLLRLHGE